MRSQGRPLKRFSTRLENAVGINNELPFGATPTDPDAAEGKTAVHRGSGVSELDAAIFSEATY
jgi:hypothetical protein